MKNKKKNKSKKKDITEKSVSKVSRKKTLKMEISEEKKKKKIKRFLIVFAIWICIFALGLVKKEFQNDTFYTIEIGELILENGIDMMDHFSFHEGLAYTYPHWLYDVFIFLVYDIGGLAGVYISSVVLLLILVLIVFRTNVKICNNYSVAIFATFICALAIGGFATARAQLVSFILFALEIYFIEMFLKDKKKRYVVGLLLISLLLCNVHVAVWPFYYILFLPYLAEYLISLICSKIKLKKENKFTSFLKNKFILEKNKNIKYLVLVMLGSLLTGLFTPIGDTPYTYLIKTMMGNSQSYIQEHQMIGWAESPFTIIITFETIFLAVFSKIKLRDLFMICGLVLMSIMSVRHISLLSLIGTICFARLFTMFLDNNGLVVDKYLIPLFNKKSSIVVGSILVFLISSLMLGFQLKSDYINEELYPVEAVKYIEENLDIDEIRLYNDYNFGSYLLFHDIPVFIDSRADLYTKQFSGFEYDVFDDYEMMPSTYQEKFEFYKITHALIYKEENPLYDTLKNDDKYEILYEDDYFCLFDKIGTHDFFVSYQNGIGVTLAP